MKKQFLTALAMVIMSFVASAQVGIETTNPAASSILDVTSTSKGLLIPRMTTAERDLIKSPILGLVIYNTTTNAMEVKNSTSWYNLTAKTTAVAATGVATTSPGVGIGTTTPDNTTILQLSSTTKGLLPPRLASSPTGVAGLVYFDNTLNTLRVYNGTSWVSLN